MPPFPIETGSRFPLGARAHAGGVNFCMFSRVADSVELLLYASGESEGPFQVVVLRAPDHCSEGFWHCFVPGLPGGTHYTWRLPTATDAGLSAHAPELLDPAAQALEARHWDRDCAVRRGDCRHRSLRAVVVTDEYDWGTDQPLARPAHDAVIYELHVGGFTRHASAAVEQPGTFAGLIEKIPYLVELGVTDVELLPVMGFDELDVPAAVAARGLHNYWGYSPCAFFAVHPGYCSDPDASRHRDEFRDLVKALHAAGIGVILDVVFNHTAEGGAAGPVINFKAMANDIFYHVDPADARIYRDYTGCGNTINCNHPLVTRYILDCLEYWVREMHVDGFRFDLASVFMRGTDGAPLEHAPLPWAIEFSHTLRDTRLIAEAWDAVGLNHVGAFPGSRWAEWNGRYRDSIRRFVRGDAGLQGEVATRMTGSSDLYGPDRTPLSSINFVTCHDGFTLWDQVSYEQKHNEANGEGNRDGHNDNLSWNCGVEGHSDDPAILDLRARQARNFIAILLLSRGVPMLLAGDERHSTQGGNNNGWCQDNSVGWLDWSESERVGDMVAFVRGMITLRKRHDVLTTPQFFSGTATPPGGYPDIEWQGANPGQLPWDDTQGHFLAYTLAAADGRTRELFVAMNMGSADIQVQLPGQSNGGWRVAADTARKLAPKPEVQAEPACGAQYLVAARSVVALERGHGNGKF